MYLFLIGSFLFLLFSNMKKENQTIKKMLISLVLLSQCFVQTTFLLSGVADDMNYQFTGLVTMVGLMTLVSLNIDVLKTDEKNVSSMLSLIMWTFMLMCFWSKLMISIYIFLETTFMVMMFMLMKKGQKKERELSSYYMFMMTLAMSMPMLLMILISSKMSLLTNVFMKGEVSMSWSYMSMMMFLVKIPSLGLHMWLPKAHVEATMMGSMILSGSLLKIGLYGIFRLFSLVKLQMEKMSVYLMSIGVVGGIISGMICFKQTDFKSIVAYSSVCHMGTAMFSMFSKMMSGVEGMLLMSVSHGYSSPMMFYVVYMIYIPFHSRSTIMLKSSSMKNSMIFLVSLMTMISSMGFPPMMPFLSEIMSINSILSFNVVSFILLIVMLMITSIYIIFFFTFSSQGGVVNESSSSMKMMDLSLTFFMMWTLTVSVPIVGYLF